MSRKRARCRPSGIYQCDRITCRAPGEMGNAGHRVSMGGRPAWLQASAERILGLHRTACLQADRPRQCLRPGPASGCLCHRRSTSSARVPRHRHRSNAGTRPGARRSCGHRTGPRSRHLPSAKPRWPVGSVSRSSKQPRHASISRSDAVGPSIQCCESLNSGWICQPWGKGPPGTWVRRVYPSFARLRSTARDRHRIDHAVPARIGAGAGCNPVV